MGKRIIKLVYQVLFYIFRIFKIKNNKVVVVNFNGRGYGDSPKYIIEKLLDKNLDIVWSTNCICNEIPSQIRQVKFQTIKWIYEMATARVWINNCRFPYYVRKRKNQFYIQTWHGGIALKKIEYDAISSLTNEYIKRMVNDTNMTDLMISNGKMCDELYRRAFKYNGSILQVGSPRNDELINNKKALCTKARQKLNISSKEKILLYSPTYRDDYENKPYDIDFDKLRKLLESKYHCKWHIIIKLHPNINDPTKYVSNINKYINGQNYSDIQELICASDLLITDYSSTMFEAMIANIPVILYANDIGKYCGDRGLNININSLPFPICQTNNELQKYIDTKKINDIIIGYDYYESTIGLVETGKASDIISKLILEKMN